MATWILTGALAALAGVLFGLVESSFDPNFGFQQLLPIFAAVVLGGIGSAYGALVGGLALGLAMELSTWSGFAGGVDPVYKPVVAFAAPDRRSPPATAGPLRKGSDRVSTIVSGDFWAFVGVVAGIYTLFALGLQIQFGFTGLLNFGQVGFMAIGAYTMAILTVKEGMSMWLAAPPRRRRGGARRDPRRAADAPPASRLLRDRHDRLRRDRPLRRDEPGRADGRLAGHDRARRDRPGRRVRRRSGCASPPGSAAASESRTRTS